MEILIWFHMRQLIFLQHRKKFSLVASIAILCHSLGGALMAEVSSTKIIAKYFCLQSQLINYILNDCAARYIVGSFF